MRCGCRSSGTRDSRSATAVASVTHKRPDRGAEPQPSVPARDPERSAAGTSHQLMAETWLGPRPLGKQVLHDDDDPAKHHAAQHRLRQPPRRTRLTGRVTNGRRTDDRHPHARPMPRLRRSHWPALAAVTPPPRHNPAWDPQSVSTYCRARIDGPVSASPN